jgi:hypothetical protein
MALDPQMTAALTNTTLEAVLGQMATAGAGGTVMIVCHAYQGGLLMPIITGGATADITALNLLDRLAGVEARVAVIRAMPEKTSQEQQAKVAAWTALFASLNVTLTGTFTSQEADAHYRTQVVPAFLRPLQLPNLTTFNRLMGAVQAVRSLKLERVELRACNIGGNQGSMAAIKKFFNCGKLLAPTVETFFMSNLAPDSLDAADVILKSDPTGDLLFNPARVRQRTAVLGRARMPGPLAHTYTGSWNDPIEAELQALPSDYSSRGFWIVRMATVPSAGPMGTTAAQMTSRFMLAILIREVSAFNYRGAIYLPTLGAAASADLQRFVAVAIMPNSGYATGALPLAGFWHPDGIANTHYVKQMFPEHLQYAPMVLPFIFPNEPRYVRLIAQV